MVNTWIIRDVQRWMDRGCPEVDVYGIELYGPSEEMLQSLAQNVDKFRDLTSFTMSGGFRVPAAFPSTLRKLTIYGVNIAEFPLQICDLPNLQLLDISHTPLPSIPYEIGRLRSLKDLTLVGNRIGYIDPQLWSLAGLRFLDLRDNERVIVPAEVVNMLSLQEIKLRDVVDLQIHPAITTMNVDIIVGLPNANLHPDIIAMIQRQNEDEVQEDTSGVITFVFDAFQEDEFQEDTRVVDPFVFDAFPEDIPLSNDCSVCMEAQHLCLCRMS